MPFEVPEGWAWTSFGYISQHNTGKTLDKEKNTGQLYEYITTSNLYWNSFDFSELRKMSFEVHELDRFTAIKGDLLICEGGDAGRSAIWKSDKPICFQNHIHRVRPLGNIEAKYLYYFILLIYLNGEIKQYLKGVGIQSLSGNSLASIIIPLPPLNEQKRIVAEINRLFELIKQIEESKLSLAQFIKQTKQKVLDLAIRGKLVQQNPNDEPVTALLEQIKGKGKTSDKFHYPFEVPDGWVWCKLGDILDIKSSKRVHKSEWKKSGIPFYRAREIIKLAQNDFVDNDLFISEEHYLDLKDKYGVPKENDILISAVGSIGKTYIVKKTDKFYYKDASVLCLSNSHSVNSSFIEVILATDFLQSQMYKNSKGTTVDTITIEKANQYIFPFPPLAEQQRIVTKIEDIFNLLDKIQESL